MRQLHTEEILQSDMKDCTLCHSSNVSILCKKQEYFMLRCQNCGLIYRMPQVLKDEYYERISKHYSQVDPSFKVAFSRKSQYQKFLHRINLIKRKNVYLLDIGCGLGYFLSLAKNEGWNAWGIEPNLDLVNKGKQNFGVDIQNTYFEEANLPPNHFDVVTLWNVFDELPDPFGNIPKIRRILKPGGILYLRIPNAAFHLFIYKVQKVLIKKHIGHILPYQSSVFHIYNFSKKALLRLFSHCGFYNIKIKNSRPTGGDPYKLKKGAGMVKILLYLLAQCIFILSWGKLVTAPSIEMFAKNAKT